MTNKALRSDAGKPHVGIGGRDVASTKPRRGSLLNTIRNVMVSLILMPFTVSATGTWSGYSESGYTATANGYTWCYQYCDGGIKILGYDDGDSDDYLFVSALNKGTSPKGAVTVPSYLDGHLVVCIGNYSFYNCSEITSITVPASVSTIGYDVFYGCSKLTSIIVDSGNTLFASYDGALYDKKLERAVYCPPAKTTLSFPSSLKNIGNSSFEMCGKLTSLTIPSSVTNIGNHAFASCSGLTSLTIPSSVTHVGCSAFSGCSGLTSLTIPSSVTHIGSYAFSSCSGLTSLTIPSAIRYIEEGTFYSCTKLTSVTFPSSVTTVGESAFANCSALTRVNCSDIASWCGISFRGAMSNPLFYAKKLYLNGSNVTALSVPLGVTSIGAYAFYNLTGLTSVTIPSSVTTVGESAFANCSALTRVNCSDIGSWCGISFNGEMANPLYYAKMLYLNGSNVTTLTVPAAVTSIGAYSFCNMSGLTSVTLPLSVTSIGSGAFHGCTLVQRVNAPPFFVMSRVFPDSYKFISSATIPEGTQSIVAQAYANCSALTNIDFPDSVTKVGVSAFAGCTKLTRVNISDLESWYGIEFDNETANPLFCARHLYLGGSEVTVLDVPGDLTSINAYAFYNASSVTSVKIPDSVTSIGTSAFRGCSGIRTVEIPATFSISSVFPDAYSRITKITIPAGSTSIAANAYYACSCVTAIEVPASVTSIGSGAFQNCRSLESVTFTGQAPACGDNVFTGTSVDMVVYAGTGTSGWTQWNGRPLAFVDPGSGSGGESEVVEKAQLTVTNVVIHYIVNSVVPEKAYPASYDTGFVNIITEVKSGGAVSVPATWMVNYPTYVTKFGGDFTKSLMKPTGKRDGAGNAMCVWQDYVAGTDPTDVDDVFTASVTVVDGKPVISYSPELNDAEKNLRTYKTWGKVKLQDADWSEVPSGKESDYNFFKVTVEMK